MGAGEPLRVGVGMRAMSSRRENTGKKGAGGGTVKDSMIGVKMSH